MIVRAHYNFAFSRFIQPTHALYSEQIIPIYNSYETDRVISSVSGKIKSYYPIKDWGRISVELYEHLYAPEIVSRLNQPGVCLNSQVMTMDIGSEAA